MTFLDLAKERYSVRSFKQEDIAEQHLQAILEAGRVAPTGCNNQPQKIYIVKDPTLRERLAAVCRCTFGAPVIAVVGYDENREWKNKLMPGYGCGDTDAAIVCTHMMLEAWEQGVGSCWVAYFNADDVARALDLPENIQVVALLPMGYPAEDAAPLPLHSQFRELDDMVTIL